MSDHTYKNRNLHAAVKSFVMKAMDVVRERCLVEGNALDKNRFFVAKLTATDELQQLPEYQACLQSLLADTTFSRQLKVLAGPRGGPKFQSADAQGLMSQLIDLGAPQGHFAFDDAYFEHDYAEMEKAYYDQGIEYQAIAPLNGFIASGPLQLSDKIEIVELDRKTGEPTLPSATDLWHEKVYGIRIKYSLPKAIGQDLELKPDHRKDDDEIREAVNKQIGAVVTALRLHGIESVWVPGILHKTSKWSFGRNEQFSGQFIPSISFSMPVDSDWLAKFKNSWKVLQSDDIAKRSFLLAAIRRFGYSCERYRSEDKIIDVLIAAEALFLSGNKYTGEIKYRLAQRSAFFLTEPGDSRRAIFDRMKIAYDLRSTTAHGGAYKKALPNKSDGNAYTLDEFVWQIQDYVRLAILKAIHLASLPETPLHIVDWDDLILNKQKVEIR
jgi:hypothetical protein